MGKQRKPLTAKQASELLGQGDEIVYIFSKYGKFAILDIVRDIQGRLVIIPTKSPRAK